MMQVGLYLFFVSDLGCKDILEGRSHHSRNRENLKVRIWDSDKHATKLVTKWHKNQKETCPDLNPHREICK